MVGLTVIALVGLPGCQIAKAGTRCRHAGETGQDATFVLQCKAGRWRRIMTKVQAAQILAALITARSVRSVATGAAHTCAATEDGKVRCWGRNSSGQLGDGTMIDRLQPVETWEHGNVIEVHAGADFTCALHQHFDVPGGAVNCWGSDARGQLADGGRLNSSWPVPSGVPFSPLGWDYGYSAVSTGREYACAGDEHGIWCWGSNTAGQLGDATTMDRGRPVAVVGYTRWVPMVTGTSHTCAGPTDYYHGGIECWGSNASGQLGDGTGVDHSTPSAVPGITNAIAFAAGGDHTCAVINNGTAQCWGSDGAGELGDGTTTDRPTPTPVTGVAGVTAITAGPRDTCVVLVDATAMCWGDNSFGQLGSGSIGGSGPAHVAGLTGVTSISIGDDHTCAVASRKLYCWGRNDAGQLGDGTTTDSPLPRPVNVAG